MAVRNGGSISDFKSALASGGARPNLFMAEVTFPSLNAEPGEGEEAATYEGWNEDLQKQFRFMCKAASLPASNIGVIEVPFRGLTMKVAGDRTVDTWTATIINNENFAIRRQFEIWLNLMNDASRVAGIVNPGKYMGNATVHQLSRSVDAGKENDQGEIEGAGNPVLASYKFNDIFPSAISAIDLSYDSTDTIEEFTVEFQVQHWGPTEA